MIESGRAKSYLVILFWMVLLASISCGGLHLPHDLSSPKRRPLPQPQHGLEHRKDAVTETTISRRMLFRMATTSIVSTVGLTAVLSMSSPAAQAAPPISVIAEELGYFPVQNRDGAVMYIPKRVQRTSTPQAIELAKRLKENDVIMYGSYWCPHCSQQKELFGAEAWKEMNYVECSPKGYGFEGTKMCKGIDGYPTFRDKTGKIMKVSGERPLEFLAQQIGWTDFDPSLEDEVPMVGTTCKLPKSQ